MIILLQRHVPKVGKGFIPCLQGLESALRRLTEDVVDILEGFGTVHQFK